MNTWVLRGFREVKRGSITFQLLAIAPKMSLSLTTPYCTYRCCWWGGAEICYGGDLRRSRYDLTVQYDLRTCTSGKLHRQG